MKNKEFAELARRLLPHLPGFRVKAPLVFISPVEHILRGICFEGSSFDVGSFYVNVFVLPLFVPRKHLSFELGNRLRRVGGTDRWEADAPNLIGELSAAVKREALPFLLRIESAHDVAKSAASLGQPQDPYVQQAIAYALARACDASEAVEALDALVRLLQGKPPWQREMAEGARALKSQLLTDASGAQKQLEAWEAESIRNLGLGKFR